MKTFVRYILEMKVAKGRKGFALKNFAQGYRDAVINPKTGKSWEKQLDMKKPEHRKYIQQIRKDKRDDIIGAMNTRGIPTRK